MVESYRESHFDMYKTLMDIVIAVEKKCKDHLGCFLRIDFIMEEILKYVMVCLCQEV